MGGRGVLGVVATATDGVETLRTGLVGPALALGWQVAVTLTPTAGRWLRANGELDLLETLTGLPVRDSPRLPAEPRPHPVADCYVVAPASANYVAKLATGIADNQALTQVARPWGRSASRWWCSPGSTRPTHGTRHGRVTSGHCAGRAWIWCTGLTYGPCTSHVGARRSGSSRGRRSWTARPSSHRGTGLSRRARRKRTDRGVGHRWQAGSQR